MNRFESMKEFHFSEDPEVLREALSLFKHDLNRNNQFRGLFRSGKIDGVFFSTGLLDIKRMFSIMNVQGHYDLEKGKLYLKLSRSTYFYLLIAIMIVFEIASLLMIGTNEQAPKLFVLFPTVIVVINLTAYIYGYHSREKEFIRTFLHYLNQVKS